jgi:hypothetical protein
VTAITIASLHDFVTAITITITIPSLHDFQRKLLTPMFA